MIICQRVMVCFTKRSECVFLLYIFLSGSKLCFNQVKLYTLCKMCSDLDVIQVKSSIFNNTLMVFILVPLFLFILLKLYFFSLNY